MEFRFRAMRQAHDPNGLDTTVNLASPRSWITLWVILFVIAGAIVWAFVGTVGQSVAGAGVLTRVGGVIRLQAGVAGVVTAAPISSQVKVAAGAAVATVTDVSGRVHVLTAPVTGTVLQADYPVGTAVAATDQIVVLQRTTGSADPAGAASAPGDQLVAEVLIPQAEAGRVYPGQPVNLAVDVVPASQYGLLRGTVRTVDPIPASARGLSSLVLDDPTAARLLSAGPMTLVQVALEPDPHTASGYAWTSAQGPPYPLTFQSQVSVSVQLPARAPIQYLLGGAA